MSRRTAISLWVGAIALVGLYLLNPLKAPSADPRLRLLGFTVFRSPSESMIPTMRLNALFVVSSWPYARHAPQVGDVIVFRYPRDPSIDYVKRVIASGGDEVSVADCVAVVNGKRLAEPYIAAVQHPDSALCNADSLKVPANQLYVLGDARENSADSRMWGFVPSTLVVGRALGY